MLASTIAYTPVIPNYKMFWLFQIHRFCYALRYTLCPNIHSKKMYLEKLKSYNLERREYFRRSPGVIVLVEVLHKGFPDLCDIDQVLMVTQILNKDCSPRTPKQA